MDIKHWFSTDTLRYSFLASIESKMSEKSDEKHLQQKLEVTSSKKGA